MDAEVAANKNWRSLTISNGELDIVVTVLSGVAWVLFVQALEKQKMDCWGNLSDLLIIPPNTVVTHIARSNRNLEVLKEAPSLLQLLDAMVGQGLDATCITNVNIDNS